MSNKSVEQIRKAYVEKSIKAQEQKQQNLVLHNLHKLSEGDKKAVETIAGLSDAVGGDDRLHELLQVYSVIKSSNKQ